MRGWILARPIAVKWKSLSIPGTQGDGSDLCRRVSSSGAKSWIQRITIDSSRRDIGLSGHPAVPLANARLLAHANRVVVAAGMASLAGSAAPGFRPSPLQPRRFSR